MAGPVLVYGWYGRGNAGDELMKLALSEMLVAHGLEPKFVDKIDDGVLEGAAGVVFGGGSILTDDPDVSHTAVETLAALRVPVFYVGVGGETEISPIHQRLINASPVVAFRELDTPDLAYWFDALALDQHYGLPAHEPKGVLVIPNCEVLPTHVDPHWKHAGWEHFKNEFAQVLDRAVERKHPLAFLSMCKNPHKDDAWCAAELMGRMSRRDNYHVYTCSKDPLWATRLMRHYRVVITQRYHGIILAEMAGVPYVSISHHNKLKLSHPHRGPDTSYYSVQKDPVWDCVEQALAMRIDPYHPPRAVYDDVIGRIAAVIKERE
jgi:hypothetical protein